MKRTRARVNPSDPVIASSTSPSPSPSKDSAAIVVEMIRFGTQAINLRIDLQHKNTQVSTILATTALGAILALFSQRSIDIGLHSPIILLAPGVVVILASFMLRYLNLEDNMIDFWQYLDERVRPAAVEVVGEDFVDVHDYIAKKRYQARGIISAPTFLGNDGFILLMLSMLFLVPCWSIVAVGIQDPPLFWPWFEFLTIFATGLILINLMLALVILRRYLRIGAKARARVESGRHIIRR